MVSTLWFFQFKLLVIIQPQQYRFVAVGGAAIDTGPGFSFENPAIILSLISGTPII